MIVGDNILSFNSLIMNYLLKPDLKYIFSLKIYNKKI